LAGEADIDPRTVERAEQLGICAIRSETDRERLRKAARRLRIPLVDRVEGSRNE
jgi:hypothetical protein